MSFSHCVRSAAGPGPGASPGGWRWRVQLLGDVQVRDARGAAVGGAVIALAVGLARGKAGLGGDGGIAAVIGSGCCG